MGSPTVQIQARLGSTRLPGKVLFPLGSRRVLGWVVERASQAKEPTDLVLSLGDRPENDAIREWCDRNGVTHHTATEENLLERHFQAADVTDSDPIVRITGDCPFVPSSEIDRVVSEHETNNARYTTNLTDEMAIGTAVDVIDIDVLEELREFDAKHPVRRLRKNPDEWSVEFTVNSRWFSDAHIAVDTPDDYWMLQNAVDAVGSDPISVLKFIENQ